MHIISGLDQGGAEAMLVRLLRALDPDCFEQSVVSLTTRGVFGAQVEARRIPLQTLGMTGFLTAPRSVAALTRTIREQQPDIVQTWLYHADLLGLVAARLAGDAAVAWNVRCSSLGAGDPVSTRLLSRVLARVSSRPDAVLFNSTAGSESHRALGYHPRRTEVIPNGFDLDERRPDAARRREFRGEIGVGDETFLIGMVARSHRVKDQSTFLAAAARLKDMNGDVRFLMVGLNHDWNNRSLVAEIEQYGLQDRIILLGLRHDVPRIMPALDCLVSTSTSEGFPNVIGEAMACGVPCVATDAGDSRLIVGDTGTIVPIGDVAGVVTGVSRVMAMTPEQRHAMSERCRHRIVHHFALPQIAERYADVYRELHQRRVARRAGEPGIPEVLERPRPALPRPEVAGAAYGSAVAVPVEAPRTAAVISRPRRAVAAGLVLAAALYGVVFYTPLVWFAGNALTLREAPTRADAIVVFSGNGEASYLNSGYQRRAMDAARYYKAGYAPLLVISSGIQQTFAEVEIIRALLLAQGVPASAMHIITSYPNSTYANVVLVDGVLKERAAKSVLFITAPYHSRRATLIWRKVAPDIEVHTVPVVDTPPATPQWHATVDEIKSIAYEYLAIAYNRSKGWL